MGSDVPPRGDDGNGSPTDRRREPTPRWVKVFGVVALAVLLLLLALALLRPGLHGPSRHAAGANAVEDLARVVAIRPPAGSG